MNAKASINFYNQSENLFPNSNKSNNPYLEVDSSYPSKKENKNNKTFQYFPIVTKNSFNGNHTIYLAAEDNGNTNNYISNNQNYVYRPNENHKKVNNKNKNKILVSQKSIELQIKNSKFEYLLINPNIKGTSNNNINNIKSNKNKGNDNLNKEEKEYSSKNNYKNIKNDFISTTQNLFSKSKEKESKELTHSYSVENYGDFPNKSLSTFTENLYNIENSKIMNQNFINNIRNPNRKNNLMKMLEKYKIFKSFNKINNNDSMNNSFTLGFDQEKYRQKSTGKIYSLGNNDNIIEEDENENSENDTLKVKSNPINKDKAKKERDNIKTNTNNNTSESEAKKRMIENCKKELGNLDRIKKVKKGEVMKKLKLKNISKNEIDISNDAIAIKKGNDNKKQNEKEIQISRIDINKNKNKLRYNIINSERGAKIRNEYFIKKIGQNNQVANIFKEFHKKNLGKKNINKTKDESSNLNESNNNEILKSINKINKSMINNNKNIPSNIHKNIFIHNKGHKPQEILVRKILREERYIIDENGKEKVLAINQSLLNENNSLNNIVKKPKINDKNLIKKNLEDSNYNSIEEKIIKKERYHRNIDKLPEKKVINIDEIQKKNLSNKIDYSFNISKIIPNKKIQRIHTTISPSYYISQNKTNQNSQKKGRFHNINFQKINNPIVLKQMDKIFQRNSPNNSNMYRGHYQNININNNLNHVIYIQNQTSPNKSPKYGNPIIRPEIPQRNQFSNFLNKNHSYLEVNSISDKKANTISKTIYHDYSNLDKRMLINKSSANIYNKQEDNPKATKTVLSRNYSSNNFQRPIAKTSRDFIIDNIYVYSDRSYKYEKNVSNDNMMEKAGKAFDHINNGFNNKYNRKVIKIENKNKYYKRKKPPNLIKKNNNTIFNRVPLGDNDYFMNDHYMYEQSRKIYPHSNSNNKHYRNKPVKSCYIKEIDTFEEREYNI